MKKLIYALLAGTALTAANAQQPPRIEIKLCNEQAIAKLMQKADKDSLYSAAQDCNDQGRSATLLSAAAEKGHGQAALKLAEQKYADYYKFDAALWALQAKQAGEELPPHLVKLLADNPQITLDMPMATPQIYNLSKHDLGILSDKAEKGDGKAAQRLADYYMYAASSLPSAERQAKADYWRMHANKLLANK